MSHLSLQIVCRETISLCMFLKYNMFYDCMFTFYGSLPFTNCMSRNYFFVHVFKVQCVLQLYVYLLWPFALSILKMFVDILLLYNLSKEKCQHYFKVKCIKIYNSVSILIYDFP